MPFQSPRFDPVVWQRVQVYVGALPMAHHGSPRWAAIRWSVTFRDGGRVHAGTITDKAPKADRTRSEYPVPSRPLAPS
ncbi:hypothetical protein GCM10009817_23960 [Terrabacter lapilli]|uniref:DUF1905 domain-containing protein n=1 Tax=Terrabacter lapilli TaxID=436231 RepID=A0ABN2S811_9MICO